MTPWARYLTIATFILAAVTLTLVGLVYVALANQREAQERSVCVSETYGPFFQGVSQALVDLNSQGQLQPSTATALTDSNDALSTLNERCPG